MNPPLRSLFRSVHLIPLVFILVGSCQNELSINLPEGESRPVVEGFLFAGESVYVRVSESEAYFNPPSFDTSFGFGAVVTIHANGLDVLLPPISSWSAYDVSLGRMYGLRPDLFAPPASGTVSLTVDYEGQRLTASTAIPPRIAIDSCWIAHNPILATYRRDIYLRSVFPAGLSHILVTGTPASSQFRYYSPGFGFTSEIQVDGTGEMQTILVPNDFFWDDFAPPPAMQIRLIVLTPEYQRYREAVIEQRDATDGFLGVQGAEPTELHGNVSGAYGFFTAVASDTVTVWP